jgi:hypothetical protein
MEEVMKKVLATFTMVLLLALGFATQVEAEDEIELYPYDKIECLQGLDGCTGYKVGDANWDLVYNGYRYNMVRGSVRYASDFDDADNDGFIDATEMPALSWNGFASLNINNTASEVILKSANRTDLTSVVHRIYAYFDENGKLAMFEDHYVTKYHIKNTGTTEAPDWRLATEAEADAYDAADPKPDDMMLTTIRIKLDATDSDGYVLEPLKSLNWYAEGVDTAVDDVEDWSAIIDGDPNYVTIPAGWSVFTFGTLDRDGSTNTKTNDFLHAMVDAMVADADGAVMEYTDQPAVFDDLWDYDDDAVTEGINMVVDYNFDFSLPDDITASWVNMFDDTTGDIINETEMLDYTVTISQDGVDLETITYTWDGSDYTASGEQTVVDSSVFGAGYVATYHVETPAGDETTVTADIVVGVMPPKFFHVEDRYVNEGMMIDLLGDILADDGYGNDLTDDILISYPDGFNPYYPQPGEYQIDLEFTHTVVFEADDSTVTIDGTTSVWDNANYNSVTALNTGAVSQYAIFTDSTMAQDVGWAWGSVMVLVGADGLVDAVYDRYTWDIDDETGAWVGDATVFEAWKDALTIPAGGFVIASHGSTISPPLRALAYDSPVSFNHTEIDKVTINGVTMEWDRENYNSVTALNVGAVNEYAIFTNSTMAQDVGWAWGSVMVLVGADGLVDAVYDRYTWDIDDETGAWVGDATVFEAWKDALAIENGGFVIASHGSIKSPPLRALTYDDPVSFAFGQADFSIDIVTEESYMLTVDDTTAPVALVVNENYSIVAGMYDTANSAILANVVAFDNYDSRDDLAIYVSNNGGLNPATPGTYDVEVTVEDYAGNMSVVTFEVVVTAAPYTDAEIDAALAALDTLTEAEIEALLAGQDLLTEEDVQALLDAQVRTDEEIQELIDAALADASGCGSSLNIGSTIVMTVVAIAGLSAFVILRKRP